MILTDDQTVEQMRALPQTRELLGSRGVTFSNSIVSYPLCCPSRATLLTGQYTQNNGVDVNGPHPSTSQGTNEVERADSAEPEGEFQFRAEAEAGALPVALSNAGYHTAFLGKYLNGYGSGAGGNSPNTRVPPGWSDWRAAVDPHVYRFWSTHLNVNGTVQDFSGEFQADVYAEQAESMIGQASDSGRPFYLQVNFGQPHVDYDPEPMYADRHATAFQDVAAPRTGSFDEADTSDKPDFLQPFYAPLTADLQTQIDQSYRDELRSLLSVDEAVARIVDRLDVEDELDNTILIMTSDNGHYHGEHRIPAGKYLPYEPAIRVPLLIAGPAVSADVEGATVDQPVANIDLTPTVLDYAEATPIRRPDGRSLRPLLEGTGAWSTDSYPGNPSPSRSRPIFLTGTQGPPAPHTSYSGVRSGDGWVYVKWRAAGGPQYELYDLTADPEQLTNLAGRPETRQVQARLERQRRLLAHCEATSCDVPPYGYLDLPPGGVAPWLAAARWADSQSLGAALRDGTFRPDGALRRRDLLNWLWRYSGAPADAPDAGVTDAPPAVADAVDWAVAAAVLRPFADHTVRPSQGLTRSEVARWLWHLAGRPDASLDHLPSDISASSPHARAYAWVLEDPPGPASAILSTGPSGLFRPAQAMTRASGVGALYRFDRRSSASD